MDNSQVAGFRTIDFDRVRAEQPDRRGNRKVAQVMKLEPLIFFVVLLTIVAALSAMTTLAALRY